MKTGKTGEPSTTKLRTFGVTVGAALLILDAAYRLVGHIPALPVLRVAGGGLIVVGLIFPGVLAPVERVWMAVANILAWINTRVILSVLFYLVFTPIGLVRRTIRDPLNRSLRDGTSYWIHRAPKPADIELYKRQF